MNVLAYVALVVFGLVLGSFVNALVWRLHEQEKLREERPAKATSKAYRAKLSSLSIAKGRSRCLACGHELAAKDLVPIASWLVLRGKCRYCGAKFPDTPVAELAVPVLFIVSYVFWPYLLSTPLQIILFVVWLASLVAFVALAIYDLRWFLLPDRVVFPLIGMALAFRFILAAIFGQTTSWQTALSGDSSWLAVLLGGLWGILILAGLFWVLYQVSRQQWIGGGDVKLAVALGLLSGGPLTALLLLFAASFSGTLSTIPLLIRGKNLRGAKIPFGPFLLLGTVITVLFGQAIINAYIGLWSV